jgi:hypothetical protein
MVRKVFNVSFTSSSLDIFSPIFETFSHYNT